MTDEYQPFGCTARFQKQKKRFIFNITECKREQNKTEKTGKYIMPAGITQRGN